LSDITVIEYNLDFTTEDDSAITLEVLGGNVTVITSGTQIEEELIGAINGINKVFTTTYNMMPGSAKVFINGIKQTSGTDFVESAINAVTFSDAPNTVGFEDKLIINYTKEL